MTMAFECSSLILWTSARLRPLRKRRRHRKRFTRKMKLHFARRSRNFAQKIPAWFLLLSTDLGGTWSPLRDHFRFAVLSICAGWKFLIRFILETHAPRMFRK